MTFRKLTIPSGSIVIQAKPCGASEPHTKTNDLSANRLRELGGIHADHMTSYNGLDSCIMVVDTETTCETGDNFGKPLIYDVGVTFVLTATGEPVAKASFIITDTFCDAKLMKAAFFTNRVFTDYPFILNMGITNLCDFSTMLGKLKELQIHYNVGVFAAYNSNFDTKAFDKTADYITRETDQQCNIGLVADLRLGHIQVLDLWALSCMTFMSHDAYKEQAFNKGWFTKGNKFGTNAEAANNFINGEEVGEDHCALSDSAIEAGIYKYCLDTQPDFEEVIELCFNGHGETWGYVNNQGNATVHNWIKAQHPEKLEEYDRLVTEREKQQ